MTGAPGTRDGLSYTVMRVWGIPIRLHLSLILFLPFLAMHLAGALQSLPLGLLTAIGLFTSIVLHELGHCYVALRKGCKVDEIKLYPFGGAARLSHMPRRPRDEIHVAIAGPIVSLSLAAVCLLGFWLFFSPLLRQSIAFRLFYVIGVVCYVMCWMNLVLGVFNLLPSFPMDGGRIFRAAMTERLGRVGATYRSLQISRVLFSLLGAYGLLALFRSGGLVYGLVVMAMAHYLYSTARREYLMVRMEEGQDFGGPGASPFVDSAPPSGGDDVIIGPPPYRRGSGSRSRIRPER